MNQSDNEQLKATARLAAAEVLAQAELTRQKTDKDWPGSTGENGKVRYGRMEEKVERLEENVDKILNNHLPHITEQITDLRVSMAKYIGIGVGAIGLLEIILKVLTK